MERSLISGDAGEKEEEEEEEGLYTSADVTTVNCSFCGAIIPMKRSKGLSYTLLGIRKTERDESGRQSYFCDEECYSSHVRRTAQREGVGEKGMNGEK
jgi:hypothetical protein